MDPFEERKKNVKEEMTNDLESDDESDLPIHEKYTKEKKFKR